MKRFFYILCALALLVVITAARRPVAKFEVKEVNFDSIRSEIKNPRSQFYYPRLMERYQRNDTSMTFEEYRHLYYGYVFQDGYNPFVHSEHADAMAALYQVTDRSYTRRECDSIEKYAELALEENIFDLRQRELYIIALKEKKKYTRAAINQHRLNHVVAAILSSGRGTQESPWVVISPEHEYNLLNFLGYVATGYESLENNIDYITVDKKNDKSPEGFYFDASMIIAVGYPEANK